MENTKTKMEQTIKQRIEELKTLYEEVTTSDLQGICMAIAFDINKNKYLEIEELLLNFVYGDIDLNKLYEEIEGLK